MLWLLLGGGGKMGGGKIKPPPTPTPDIAEPEPEFERVHCTCPEYKGSDFWNDPHRWCDRDPVKETIWVDKERTCERTVRPKLLPKPEPCNLQNLDMAYMMGHYSQKQFNMLQQANYLGNMQVPQQTGYAQSLADFFKYL